MKQLIGLLGLLIALPTLAATYTYTGPFFNSFTNHTTCTLGTCTDYSSAMHVTGSFSTATPLAPNLANSDISAAIASYSFNDGINTIASSNPNARISIFQVSTDNSGAIIPTWAFSVYQWSSGVTGAHVSGDRLNFISSVPNSINERGVNNVSCTSVGVADTCTTAVNTSDTSIGFRGSTGAGTWISPLLATPVPTLSTWSMIVLFALIALFGWYAGCRNSFLPHRKK